MASFERSIPPGGEGKIRFTLRTKNYEGYLFKSARVYTNDPNMREFTLSILAFVKAPIYLLPPYVSFYALKNQGDSLPLEVRAGLEKPLTLEASQFSLEGKVAYEIEEIEKGRRFKIHFTNLPGPAENYVGYLNLKTNYPEKPLINVRIIGRFPEGRKASGP
ncbi:MAG: DUF1573 domain-containing protein [Proteobacteria bacterium]|nr:DUF1573 domain-containing protein [Pseudomonadota bacterium]